MRLGVPREIKPDEYRVGLTPASAHEIALAGHDVIVEAGAGAGIGAADGTYQAAGATIVPDAATVFAASDLIVKVKEPQAAERAMLRPGQVLFTYLHLAADPDQAMDLVRSGVVAIAYETVTDAEGRLPLLAPMSKVAGRLAVQAGATALETVHGGAGLLIGGIPGVAPAKVTVLGGGVVGENAIDVALGMGADVTVLDRSLPALDRLAARFGPALTTIHSNAQAVREHVLAADLVVGAVLVTGAAAPKLVTAEMVAAMRDGSVLVDVAVDQGGCFETTRPTTHAEPTYIVDGVVHYAVANMPGAVPKTSTLALNAATLPHVLHLAERSWRGALQDDPHLQRGLNVCQGRLIHPAVAESLGFEAMSVVEALSA